MVIIKPAENYSKSELDRLIREFKAGDRAAEFECINFVLGESFGVWHGRARAKICRNLKNHAPDAGLSARLVEKVIWRLENGEFSEQFKDQLTMAIRFAPDRMLKAATLLLDDKKDYVRRYANWVCSAIARADEGHRSGLT